MGETNLEAITEQVARELKELQDAPMLEITTGPTRRCSICGKPSLAADMRLIEKGHKRLRAPLRFACRECWDAPNS
jgi:hypothetical protein